MSSSKFNIIAHMQRWMESIAGQTFLNYAYNWGAAIVILGTLFKLTHLAGANLMLFIGMGTEVVVFFISAFDRPFDKERRKEEEEEELDDEEIEDDDEEEDDEENNGTDAKIKGKHPIFADSTVVIGGGSNVNGNISNGQSSVPQSGNVTEILAAGASTGSITANQLIEVIKMANDELLSRAQAAITPELEEASKEYTEKLKLLTETLDRVEKQSARLTNDSDEMTNLNRTLTGINTIYELQLKSVSKQITSIDRINEQTRFMAEQIEELNGIYTRMIKALTINMKNAAANHEA